MAKPTVLLLTLEYPRWADAGKYAYESNFGLEEGFAANGIACTTVPLMFCGEGSAWAKWFDSVYGQLQGKRFDQVWFDVVHSQYPPGFLEFIHSLAPTRVGFFGESSEFHPEELARNAAGVARRRANVERALPVATHLIAVDEADVARFNVEGKTPAFWWAAGSIPRRFITEHPPAPMGGRGMFHGTLYGNRQEWLERPELQGLLARGTTMENDSPWPAQYDELNESVAGALANGVILGEPMFSRFIAGIRQTRQACYPLWLQSLRQGCAVVNLPQFAKAYASRVTQGLAAGMPVVTWEIPNRPRTRALFEPGREILVYAADQPGELAAHIRQLQRDPGFARGLAENALRKMRAHHTTEGFVANLVNWVETGNETVAPATAPRDRAPRSEPGFQLYSPGDLVFDIGANSGLKTAKFLANGARVVCFEPQPMCVEQLQARFAGHPDVKVVGSGLASAPGTLQLSICSAANTISTFSEEWKRGRFASYEWDQRVAVPVTTLDAAIVTHGRPRYAKIDVEGYELEVLRGLSWPIPVLSFEFTSEYLDRAGECLHRLETVGYRQFNAMFGEEESFAFAGWMDATQLLARLRASDDPTLWGDVYARCESVPAATSGTKTSPLIEEIRAKAGGHDGQPLRLHLGCGEQRFDGYVNIDYPPAEHNVMNVKADVFTNVITMELPPGSIDEVRLHHVFEHFNRVTALAMLIKWQRWLKPGGILRIETPDLAGCARTLLSNTSLRVKMGIVRHLAGDQAASWAYHLEHWFPERYVHTLRKLGFDQVQTKTNTWATEPFLSNVEALAVKTVTLPEEQLLALADDLLRESMVADCEQPTWEVWRQQLRDCLRGNTQTAPINIPTPAPASNATILPTPANRGHRDLYLGLKFYGHDAAVFSVFPDEQDIFAIAEERLTRFKHDDLFPLDAIRRMLAYKGIDAAKVENLYVGGAFRCQKDERLPARAYDRTVALRRFLKAPYTKEFAQASREFYALPAAEQIKRLQNDPAGREFLQLANDPTLPQTLDEQFRLALGEIFPNATLRLNYHDHEYCHAVSAYYSSGFDRALVVAFDGWGDDNTFSRVYLAENGQLSEISACRSATRELRVAPGIVHETSIGGIYSWFTRFLGFTPDADEGKVEALAAFGKWDNAIYHDLMSLVAVSPERGIEINHAKATELLNEERLRPLLATSSKEDFSAAMQKFTEEVVLAYLRPLVEKTGVRKICLSGGVTANVILNLRIFQELAEEVFIIPAMADDGSAQGAAILELLGQGFSPAGLKWLGAKQMPYWGSSYSPTEVRQRINRFNEKHGNCLAIQDDSAAWPETAAEAICRGETGAIFHGRMEWGPRALGNRSIIADARNPKMRDILNRDIKNRPSFQPFCPSMLAEERERLFERSYQNRHMTIAFEMKREFWEALPGAIHIDGTARVQFVEPPDNPDYHRLLTRVKEITGFGVILNTSFNKHGRTIVESPEDALRDFLDSKLDFVVIEGHVVRKAKRPAEKPRAKTTGIVFSKDRALQLDATLRSFALHCQDAQELALTVLYTTTSADHEQAYEQLRPAHPEVNFVREKDFKPDLLALVQGTDNVLFLVDDNLFVRDFSLREAVQHLEADSAAVGFSLRLGQNTTYCYPLAQAQRLPEFATRGDALAFHWPTAEHDFGYPLEVSSSLYRVADLAPLLAELDYRNPNTLEAGLAANASRFTAKLPRLLCFAQSVAFCAPVNVVQSTYQNRCGARPECSAAALAREFMQGARVDLAAFNGFVPTGCHQEVELKLTRGTNCPAPAVSVVIPCYNQAGFLSEAVSSVVAQTFADWEIIIVNDGSQDNTSGVARELIAAQPTRRIRLLEKVNGGLSDARNAGIRSAAGRFILPLDADDLLHPDFLARTVACLEQQPATAIVYTDVEQFGVRNELWHTQSGDPRQVLANTRHAYCALYRREVWEKVGGYNRNMVWGYEDWDFWVGCFEHGFQETRIAEPLMRYRTKAESMVTRALQHDAELRAQIIKNHPALYDAPSNAWAEKTLREAKQTTQAGADDPVEALLQSAGALFQTGDLRGVLMILERAATRAPENGEIAESLGTVAFQAGDMGRAFTHLGRAVALRPEKVETLVKLAMAAAQAGEIATFESSLARALELAPEHPSALRLLGGLNLQMEHWAGAATTYYRLLRQNPADVDATLALGRCFYELKDLESARDSFEQVLALDPANEIARDNLAVIHKKLPPPSAQGMTTPATWPAPPAPASLDHILAAADQEFGAGNLTGARDQLRQAILLAPDNIQVIETLGSILFQLGDFGGAQVEFTLLASLSPDQAGPLVKLALSQLRLGRTEEFEAALGRALELEPEHPDALRLLADLHRDHRGFAEAARLYLKLLGPNPQDVETLFSLAFCFFQSGELDAARASYERILELEPANAVARENLAVVLAKLTGTNDRPATPLTAVANEPATGVTSPSKPSADTTPLISVVLPTYNRPAILARCLEGFAQQTLAREQFEIVVVDDGSEPPVGEVVATFTDRLRITCHFQANAGLAAARNQAIALARGPWLALHDDDDVPAPDYLARCVAFHEAHPGEADILLARLVPHPDLEVTPLLEWVFDAANGVIGFPAPGMIHNFSKFYGGTSSCKRSLFTRAQYDPEYRFGFEDMELALRLDQTIKLQVHYHPEVFSELVRTVEFSGLFRRMYREGRSLRRCFEKHGRSALALMPEGIDRSIETLARIEPHVPGLFKLLERLGTQGNPEVTLALDGRVLRGPSALKAVYSLLSRFGRAKGWADFGRLVTEAEGLRQINVCLAGHRPANWGIQGLGDPVSTPAEAGVAPASVLKRALVYFHSNPFPARSGAHRRCLSVLAGLRTLGYEIHLASSDLFTDQPWTDESVFGLLHTQGVHAHPYFASEPDREFVNRAAAGPQALWEMHTPPGLVARFRELARELEPALVLINYAYCAPLIAGPEFVRTTCLVEMHDLVSLGGAMARAASACLPPAPLTPAKVSLNFLDEDFFARLDLRIDPEEFAQYARFDGVNAISASEAEMVRSALPAKPVAATPVTILPVQVENTYAEDPLLVIFSNPFNLQGTLYFTQRVLPKIRRAFPEFKLRVVGDACRHLGPIEGLELLGFVPDLATLYAESKFAICPLIGGTGQQVKIVEAMAHGLPVVALRNVAASSPLECGVNGYIANDAEEFAEYVIRLYSEPELCRKLGAAARATIAREFSPAKMASCLEDLIVQATAAKKLHQAQVSTKPNPATVVSSDRPHSLPPVTRPVRWLAPFFNPSGYASEAINFVVPLANKLRLGIQHHNRIYSEAFVAGLAPAERETLFRLRDNFASLRGGIVIYHTPAGGFGTANDADHVIGRTMYEAEGLPANWVNRCNLMDEIWVPSHFNLETFAAAGVEREKLVVMPEAVDESVFDPSLHTPLELPRRAKFNFLAVFEWTTRKGWDALLGAYLQEFSASDDVCLYLRAYLVNEPDGDARARIERKISDFAKSLGLGDKAWPRIEILSEQIPSADLPRLYRAVDCLVAPSRGEGWGRPQHEAMMMGLPVIATGWSGNTEFMTPETAYLVGYDLVTAAQLEPELWHYRGHRWANPRVDHLRQLMREVEQNPRAAATKGQAARRHVLQHFSRPAVAERVQRRLAEIETQLNSPVRVRRAPQVTALSANPKSLPAIPVAWNGTFLDYGSLSQVNRELTRALEQQPAVKLTRVGKNVLPPELAKTPALQDVARQLRAQAPAQAQVVIRHAWPPNWEAPANGAWVMMQPWEFGALPLDWVKQLDRVDEVWAYTECVRRVYVDSGVDPAKVKVVPLGIDPAKFRPEAKPLALTTAKTFKFLFIGGTIHRKGPDVLLKAFLEAFSANDDVCLVIKDFGGKSVYAGQTMSEQIQALQTNPNTPEILYLTDELPPEALPGLYTACDCLVHPYRGEGFGLPVLEAMACGLPVVVTAGGSTDDFTAEETAYRIPARRHSIGPRLGEWELVRNGWLLEPDHDALVTTMKRVVQNPAAARAKGAAASTEARQFWTWERAARVAGEHIQKLNERKKSEQRALAAKRERKAATLVLPAAARAGQLAGARQLLQAGNHAGALVATRAALAERPFHPEAWLLLAELAATMGHPAIAHAWSEHTVRLAPGFRPAKQFLKTLRSPMAASKVSATKASDWPQPDAPATPCLSVCLIVRNEEKFLPGCLRSLQGIAAQIVVVDTGSTDRTVEIARSFGAEVFSTPWTDDFSAARNAALERARGDWVLILDADEELAPGAGEKLARALRAPGVMAYRLPIVDAGREEEGCSYVPRLFRNAPGLFYVGRIHEQVFSSVEVRREEWGLENRLGDVTLWHHGYTAEVTRDRDKVTRNLRLLERAIEEMPNEPNLLMNFGLELVRAGQLEAGLVQYREACQTLAALPASQIVPELRETLLTQLATHLMAAKQHEEIVHLLRSSLARMAPLTASLHFVLGLALMELRHPLDAAEQFKACLQKRNQTALSPVNRDIRKAGPRHCLALCLAQLKRLTEAGAVFEEALMDDPHSRPMRFDYARLLHELGRPLDAIKLLHQLVAERADDLPVWQLGGQIALSQPQFHEFADDWTREARQHFPQDNLLCQQQAEALLFNHKAVEALPLLHSLENGTAHRATAAAILGELLANQSPHARAMLNEPVVSQEFLLWYRRLIKANASEAVQSVNEQLDTLDHVLPSATRVLRQAVQASNEPARQTGPGRAGE